MEDPVLRFVRGLRLFNVLTMILVRNDNGLDSITNKVRHANENDLLQLIVSSLFISIPRRRRLRAASMACLSVYASSLSRLFAHSLAQIEAVAVSVL